MDCIIDSPYVKGTAYHPWRGGFALDICRMLRAIIANPAGKCLALGILRGSRT